VSFVERIMTHFDRFREELNQTAVRCQFVRLRDVWNESLESRDGFVEGFLKGLAIYHTIVLV